MTDESPCPSCGKPYCYGLAPGDRCCTACSGNHESDTYERYYPPVQKETNR